MRWPPLRRFRVRAASSPSPDRPCRAWRSRARPARSDKPGPTQRSRRETRRQHRYSRTQHRACRRWSPSARARTRSLRLDNGAGESASCPPCDRRCHCPRHHARRHRGTSWRRHDSRRRHRLSALPGSESGPRRIRYLVAFSMVTDSMTSPTASLRITSSPSVVWPNTV